MYTFFFDLFCGGFMLCTSRSQFWSSTLLLLYRNYLYYLWFFCKWTATDFLRKNSEYKSNFTLLFFFSHIQMAEDKNDSTSTYPYNHNNMWHRLGHFLYYSTASATSCVAWLSSKLWETPSDRRTARTDTLVQPWIDRTIRRTEWPRVCKN